MDTIFLLLQIERLKHCKFVVKNAEFLCLTVYLFTVSLIEDKVANSVCGWWHFHIIVVVVADLHRLSIIMMEVSIK